MLADRTLFELEQDKICPNQRKTNVRLCRLEGICGHKVADANTHQGEIAMTSTRRIQRLSVLAVPATLAAAVLLAGQQAHGQVAPSSVAPALSTPALEYFGKNIRKPMAQKQSFRRQAPQQRPLQLSGAKPFQNIHRPPTISPYLSLDAIESSVGLPNYYSRVLPQIQQQQASQAQAAQLRRLQQQVRTASRPGAIRSNRNGGVPTTGHSSQFLNVGSYFPPIRQ